MGHDAVDNTDIKLMLDKNGHLRPCERGLILQEMLRRDQFRLMNEMSQIIIPWKKLGNTMARDLSNLLRKCRKLELLDLENNFIGCVGCIELSKALSTHPGIRTLNLAGNKVADLGAAMLSSMLLSNTTLTHLDLSGNRLEKEAMQGLGGGLRGNTTLHTLILDENYFGDEGANELSWALTINSSLHTLSIRGNVSSRPALSSQTDPALSNHQNSVLCRRLTVAPDVREVVTSSGQSSLTPDTLRADYAGHHDGRR